MKKLLLGFVVLIFGIGLLRACFSQEKEDVTASTTEAPEIEKEGTYEDALTCLIKEDYAKATLIYNDLRFNNKKDPNLPLLKEKFNSQLKDSITAIDKKINRLKNSIAVDTDEFEKTTWYKPKFQKHNYESTVYAYFGKTSGHVNKVRLVLCFYGDNWIFWDRANFLIDGENIEYVPIETPSRTNSSSVWETSDEVITASDLIIIDKMQKAKSVKYRFVGKDYVKDFVLSKNRITDLQNILNYHDLLEEQIRLSEFKFLN